MKKTIICTLAAFGFMLGNGASAQALEEGNVVVDVYYGFPNLYSAVFKSAYANSGSQEDIKISGSGPFGIRGEYLLDDKFGIGLDIGFNNTKLSFRDQVTEFDGQGNPILKTYDYDYLTKKLGVMVTFNYHFVDNDNLDVYAVLGAGYGSRSFTFESTDPNYQDEDIKSLIPIAAKLGIGLRYFVTDNIGFNLAAGIGQGGLLNAGVSFKF